jgi:hypothetical protein
MEHVTPIPALTLEVARRDALLQEYAECGFLLRRHCEQVDSFLDYFQEKAVKVSKKGKFTLTKETNVAYLYFRDLYWWNFSSDASRKGRAGCEMWNHTDNCVVIDFREVDYVEHGGVRHSLENLVSRGPHLGWPTGVEGFGRLSKNQEMTPTDVELCLSVIKTGREWLDKAVPLIMQCDNYANRRGKEVKRHALSFRKLLDRGTLLFASLV